MMSERSPPGSDARAVSTSEPKTGSEAGWRRKTKLKPISAYTHTDTYAQIHGHTHTHSLTHTQTHTHVCTDTHPHTHTHTPSYTTYVAELDRH